jgi:hypothetical protein
MAHARGRMRLGAFLRPNGRSAAFANRAQAAAE